MNLMDTLLEAGQGAVAREIGGKLGLNATQAQSAMEQLLPSIARGIQRNSAQPGGLDALLGALKSGNHQRYVDHPEELTQGASIADGNAILGHILGSKDVSRNVAGRAAAQSGIGADILKQMLPMVAAAAMGSLGKQVTGGGSLSSLSGGNQGGMANVLESFLDADRDGAVLDDVLGLAKKFF